MAVMPEILSTHRLDARSSLLQSTEGVNVSDSIRLLGGRRATPLCGKLLPSARVRFLPSGPGVSRTDTRARGGVGNAAYRERVPKIAPKNKDRTSGRLSNRFWKLLGASTDKDQAQSMDLVRASAEFDDKAAGLDDEKLQKAAKLLNLDQLAESADIPQFLAIAREASERATTLRPFDVQLLGALRMLAGDVVEMATGEGKTLAGAIAAAGYAIGGRTVHVISVNDYLARRDAQWMGPLLEAMGLTVGWITAESTPDERRTAYACNVTYASVNEIGF